MAGDSLEIKDMTRGVYRLVYAGFLHGKRINAVSIEAEAFLWRIYMLADDFGNLRADPELLRVMALPKRKDITTAQVVRWLAELSAEHPETKTSLTTPYKADGEDLVHINSFVELQPFNRGRNGKAKPIRRVPEWAGESKNVQMDQGASRSSKRPHSDTHSDTNTDTQPKPGGGGGGLRSLTPEGEAAAQRLSKAPDWLKPGQGWLDADNWRDLIALGLPASSYRAAITAAHRKRATLKNPAGWILSELRKAAAQLNGSGKAGAT